MKVNSLAFLFFCGHTLIFVCCLCWVSYGQQPKDSLGFYSKLALQPQKAEDLYKADVFFTKNYSSAIRANDLPKAIHYLYYTASIAYKQGDYDACETTAVKALELLDTLEPSAYTRATTKSFYNLLGILYEDQRNKPKALELYAKTMAMAANANDSAMVYNNIAVVHRNYKALPETRQALLKAYTLLPRVTDTLTRALILDNLGVLQSNTPGQGLALLQDALALRTKLRDSSKLFLSYMHLADYYRAEGDTLQSKHYALKALAFAETLNAASYRNKALGLLVHVSPDAYAQAYKTLNDSLYQAEQDRQNQFALIRYDVAKKDKALLKSQNDKERIILVALLVIISIISMYIYQRTKHKKEKLLQIMKTESKISKQIHDEVANNVFQVITRLEQDKKVDTTIVDDLDTLYKKTRDISKEYAPIESSASFEKTLRHLMSYFNNEDTNIIVKGLSTINWDRLPSYKLNAIYKVLQELLVNMKKHSKASLVVLSFEQKSKNLLIEYKDNGVGGEIKKGSGLQNAENRISDIGGRFNFESQSKNGFKVQLYV